MPRHQGRLPDEELDSPAFIPEIGKHGFAVRPDGVEPARGGDRFRTLLMPDITKLCLYPGCSMETVKTPGEDDDPALLQADKFLHLLFVKVYAGCFIHLTFLDLT